MPQKEKQMKNLIITMAALATLSGTAYAGPQHTHSHVIAQNKKTVLICPVTGDKISSVRTAAGHSAFKGKTYYFCCADCKPRFDKSPAKFARSAAKGKFEKM